MNLTKQQRYQKEYFQRNKERIRIRKKLNRQRNRESVRKRENEYNKRNPSIRKKIVHNQMERLGKEEYLKRNASRARAYKNIEEREEENE